MRLRLLVFGGGSWKEFQGSLLQIRAALNRRAVTAPLSSSATHANCVNFSRVMKQEERP
ncbi:MAG: hypothetical protein RL197_721 [Actinomycetota bacterium]|jgi:hypothetical protein